MKYGMTAIYFDARKNLIKIETLDWIETSVLGMVYDA